MEFTIDVVRQAFLGYGTISFPELHVSDTIQIHQVAIDAIRENYEDFCSFIDSRLDKWKLTKHYLGRLVDIRLQQHEILASGLISCLFDDENPLEQRLGRIHGQVENLEEIVKNAIVSKNKYDGKETDEKFRDIWNEFFCIDFIMQKKELEFTDIKKIVLPKNQSQVDLVARHSDEDYAIEITRMHKRDFEGSTMPNMYNALYEPTNCDALRSKLSNKLHKKNKQMGRFCALGVHPCSKKLLILKTSQEEYQDGKQIVYELAKTLLNSGEYPHIDEVLLIYDIETYDWLK